MDKADFDQKDIKKCFDFLKKKGIIKHAQQKYDEGYKYITYPIKNSKGNLLIVRISGIENFSDNLDRLKKKLIERNYDKPGRNLLPPTLTTDIHVCAKQKTTEKSEVGGFIIENRAEEYEENIVALAMSGLKISLEDYLLSKTNKYYKYCVILKILHAFAVYHELNYVFPKSKYIDFGKNIYLDNNYEIKFINIYDKLEHYALHYDDTIIYKKELYKNFIKYIVDNYIIDIPLNNLLLIDFDIDEIIEENGNEIPYVLNFIEEVKENIKVAFQHYNLPNIRRKAPNF